MVIVGVNFPVSAELTQSYHLSTIHVMLVREHLLCSVHDQGP